MTTRRSVCLPPFPRKSPAAPQRAKVSHLLLIKPIADLMFALLDMDHRLNFNTTALCFQGIFHLNPEKDANIWGNIEHPPNMVAGITLTIAASASNKKTLTLSITTEPRRPLSFMSTL